MHPIVYPELGTVSPRRPWTDLLRWGGLPSVLDSETPRDDLPACVGRYLQEEIRAEGLARSAPNFSRLLETAAAMSGDLLPPFQRTRTRKAVTTEKFYFFDVGVTHALVERWAVSPRTPEYGRVLDHLVEREVRASLDDFRCDRHIFFWRSLSRIEAGLVITKGQKPVVAIGVKASRSVSPQDLKGLRAFGEDWPRVRKIMVSPAPPRVRRRIEPKSSR
jgi:predicted AAA+ superfamily ATPase